MRTYFETTRRKAVAAGDSYDPCEIIGCGPATDVLTAGRLAMQTVVEEMMSLFGSAGKA